MDSSNSKTIPSSPSDIIKRYYSNNAPFHSTYRRQTFPFRDTLIRDITNNPVSSKYYQKMIQSCKYFFIKSPIIIVPKLSFIGRKGWYTLGSRSSKDRPKDVYLNEITSKIWITDSLIVHQNTPNTPVITSFMPKIYQFIASKCEIFHLTYVVIINNDEIVPDTAEDQFSFETVVSLEAFLKALPNVKSFTYDLPFNSLNIITTKTAEELLKIPQFLSLDEFGITEIPEIFDIQSFYGHIKKNKKTKIGLHFSDQISDEYKIRLQTIVDEILETENRDYKVPRIYFSGMTDSSNEKLHALYNQK